MLSVHSSWVHSVIFHYQQSEGCSPDTRTPSVLVSVPELVYTVQAAPRHYKHGLNLPVTQLCSNINTTIIMRLGTLFWIILWYSYTADLQQLPSEVIMKRFMISVHVSRDSWNVHQMNNAWALNNTFHNWTESCSDIFLPLRLLISGQLKMLGR